MRAALLARPDLSSSCPCLKRVGFPVSSSGFGVSGMVIHMGLACRASGLGFGVEGLGFGLWGSEFRVLGLPGPQA